VHHLLPSAGRDIASFLLGKPVPPKDGVVFPFPRHHPGHALLEIGHVPLPNFFRHVRFCVGGANIASQDRVPPSFPSRFRQSPSRPDIRRVLRRQALGVDVGRVGIEDRVRRGGRGGQGPRGAMVDGGVHMGRGGRTGGGKRRAGGKSGRSRARSGGLVSPPCPACFHVLLLLVVGLGLLAFWVSPASGGRQLGRRLVFFLHGDPLSETLPACRVVTVFHVFGAQMRVVDFVVHWHEFDGASTRHLCHRRHGKVADGRSPL